MRKKTKLEYLSGISLSFILLLLSIQDILSIKLTIIEAIAIITSAWSVWFLSRNNIIGWWIGLIGVITYSIVFYQAKLYGEVGIQIFYFLTSIQGIYIWLHGGTNQAEKPIQKISQKLLIITIVIGLFGIILLRWTLIKLGGVVPGIDAITTIISMIAQIYLMQRYLESWYLWIGVDIIYIPLYASRELYFTSVLYVIFLLMAIKGLSNFKKVYQEQQLRENNEVRSNYW